MLLVKKCQIFLYLDLVKLRLEIMLNNFGEKKKLFLLSKQTFLTVPQISFFQRGLTHAFGKKKCFCFHYLFSPKMRLELRFNNILKRKQALFF